MKVGSKVKFADHVFSPPYTPFYDKYKGQIFQVVAYHYEYSHIELKCLSDPTIHVDGYVHLDEIVEA